MRFSITSDCCTIRDERWLAVTSEYKMVDRSDRFLPRYPKAKDWSNNRLLIPNTLLRYYDDTVKKKEFLPVLRHEIREKLWK